jgi:hypothetical protein
MAFLGIELVGWWHYWATTFMKNEYEMICMDNDNVVIIS